MGGRATVIVGVDGSAESGAALLYALEDAVRRGGVVRVVAVFPSLEYWAGAWGVSPQRVTAELEADLREQARTMVDAVVTGRTALAAVPVEVHAIPGCAAQVLVEQSRAADLLVVGHRGHGALATVLPGSVALRCVLHAECLVTVVRPVAKEPVTERRASVAHRVADAAVSPTY
jgi:nucleotide-binding universal stress UspA family protein